MSEQQTPGQEPNTDSTNPAGENNAGEANTPDPWAAFPPEFNWVRKELEDARKEAAAKRVEARQFQEKLAAAKSPEEVQQLTADYDKKITALDISLARERVARQAGLQDDLLEFLTGTTEEEIKSQAEKLVALKKSEEKPPVVVTQQAPRGGQNPSQEPTERSGREEYEKWKASRF